jgi:17beta-estradiol 17-dehydrogenase / very-long-chain 3-oxoacyl-CoA reductase
MGPFLKQALVILPLLGTSVWLALNSYQDLIGFLGITFSLILCSWFISSVFSFLWNSILAPAMGLGVDFRKMGKWALVTGATDGIGLAYSKQLAEMGLNIVLISRTKDRLESVARQIETMYRVKTKVIQVDFSQHMEHYEKRLQNELSGECEKSSTELRIYP